MSDLGLEAIQQVRSLLQLDPRWSLSGPRGFAWWGHRLRQRVWAEPGVERSGDTLFRLRAETDLLADVDIRDPVYALRLGKLNALASLSAAVFTSPHRVALSCHAFLHAENADRRPQIFAAATALQAALAAALEDEAPELIGGRLDDSAHPESGPRPEPDDILSISAHATEKAGEPCWRRSEEWQMVDDWLARLNGIATVDVGEGLTAKFAFGSKATTLLQVSTHTRHPILGWGLRLLLRVPVGGAEDELSLLAAQLNQEERSGDDYPHLLGGWHVTGEGVLAFAAFYPEFAFKPGVLLDLTLNMAVRACWVGRKLTGEKEADISEILGKRLSEIERDDEPTH